MMGELFAYDERCRDCFDHGEKHIARHEWVPGQPETYRVDCEYCRKRDAIKDGSVQAAMIKRMEKRARKAFKDFCLIDKDQLSPLMKQSILDDCERAISAVNELIALTSASLRM